MGDAMTTRAQDDAGIAAAVEAYAESAVDAAGALDAHGIFAADAAKARAALFAAIDAWGQRRDVAVCRAVTVAYHLAHAAQEVSLGNIAGAAELAVEANRLIAEERDRHPLVTMTVPRSVDPDGTGWFIAGPEKAGRFPR